MYLQGVLTYGSAFTWGMSVSEKVYDDADADDIEKSLPETAFHRHVDLPIVRADQEGAPHFMSSSYHLNQLFRLP